MRRGVLDFLDAKVPIIFVVPAVGLIGLVSIYPLVFAVRLSFTNMHLIYGTSRAFMIDNYIDVLNDPRLWHTLYNNLIWLGGCISLQFSLGMVIALLLDRPLPGKGAFQTLLIAPWAFSAIACVFTWKWLLEPSFGVINHTLVLLGFIPRPIGWFGSASRAMLSVIGVHVWYGLPFMALCLYAGLQSIPESDYDVAKIEGASALQTLWHVILPRLRIIIATLVVLRSIWIFNNFNFIFLSTGGGPGRLTETMPIYAYNIAWSDYLMGKGCAVTVIMFGILIVMIVVYFKLFKLAE